MARITAKAGKDYPWYHSDQEVDDALFAELRKHYSDDALVELTGLIAFQNMSSKFNAALDLPAQGFCEWRPNA